MTTTNAHANQRLLWPDWVRAFALFGILLNHFVESFAAGPIFTHPSSDWPAFSERISRIWPQDYDSIAISLFQFLGWLGDNCVGVFILVSGFGLAYSGYRGTRDFFSRRFLRIYPAYIAAHFLILLLAIPFDPYESGFDNYRTVFSILGLRFSDGLFFVINPSWWFVWLILQLYLVFPVIWKFLGRYGPAVTFAAALLITIASRAYAALYSESTYFLYAGMFGGSRLVEFVVGVMLGHALASGRLSSSQFTNARLLAVYVPLYVFGFALSLTWVGSTVSNLFISVGLSGIFAAVSVIFASLPLVNRVVTWLSAHSYAIYLIHQPPLIWLRSSDVNITTHLIIAVGWYALCVPLSYLIETAITRIRAFVTACRELSTSEAARAL